MGRQGQARPHSPAKRLSAAPGRGRDLLVCPCFFFFLIFSPPPLPCPLPPSSPASQPSLDAAPGVRTAPASRPQPYPTAALPWGSEGLW